MAKNLIVSYGEKSTNHLLHELFKNTKYKVSHKVRLADIFDINEKKWTSKEGKFMLMAHFDFVITKHEYMKPLLAVEFDGEYHNDEKQIERDILKEKICEKSKFPLCRFKNEDLKQKNGIQPAIDKLFKITEIFSTILSFFTEKLDKQQLFILANHVKWQLSESPWKTLVLPDLSEISKRLHLNKKAIFIKNSLKYGVYYAMSKKNCEKTISHPTTKDIVDSTINSIAKSNDIELQHFVCAILLEVMLHKRPDNISIEKYIKKTFPNDSKYQIDIWRKFLLH